MKSIYCTGPMGKVGWVSGWDFDQADHTKVAHVRLTLNHLNAHRFAPSEADTDSLVHVLRHIRKHEGTYGSCGVFRWEEP